MSFTVRLIIPGAALAAAIAGFVIDRPDHDAVSVISSAQAQQTPSAGTTVTAAGVTLRSVSVDLPLSERIFPGGAEADAINNNCLSCHSASMVLHQPALPRSTWLQLVEKMRSQYKAPVAEQDVPAIVSYLTSHKGR
jgi:hypothetical protein